MGRKALISELAGCLEYSQKTDKIRTEFYKLLIDENCSKFDSNVDSRYSIKEIISEMRKYPDVFSLEESQTTQRYGYSSYKNIDCWVKMSNVSFSLSGREGLHSWTFKMKDGLHSYGTDRLAPKDFIHFAQNLNDQYPEWDTMWEALVEEAQKYRKQKHIAETGIETMLKVKMRNSGIPYSIERQKTRIKVSFDVGSGCCVQMALSHKNFMSQIDSVINAAVAIRNAVTEVGQPMSMKRTSAIYDWISPAD